jgi:hypothetical protein
VILVCSMVQSGIGMQSDIGMQCCGANALL